jgi:hypothetical protein
MNSLSTLMESTYSTAMICDYDEDPDTCVPTLELEPRKHQEPILRLLNLQHQRQLCSGLERFNIGEK